MSFDYAKTAATVLRLLGRFGTDVTISRSSAGAYDPETGKAASSTATWMAKAARGEPYSSREIDGTLIMAGDLKLIVSADETHDLEPGDTITIEAEVWRVVKPNPVRPATTTVAYMAQLRK